MIANGGDDLELALVISNSSLSLSDLNKWNREKRFAYAYFNLAYQLVLKSDLFFEGGYHSGIFSEFYSSIYDCKCYVSIMSDISLKG